MSATEERSDAGAPAEADTDRPERYEPGTVAEPAGTEPDQ
jgi:hypothetical protein